MYIISIIFAKTINFFSKLLKIGSGNTWPGHFILKVNPKFVENVFKRLPENVVIISGTNGKTTTTKLLTHLLKNSGHSVLSNDSGANLLNGVVSSVLLNSSLSGKLKYDYVVLEVDELTLPKLTEYLKPSVLALLNLSRDQLDRHWETDIVFEKWLAVIRNLNEGSTLILNSMQEQFKDFAKKYQGKTLYFDENRNYLRHTELLGSFNARNVNCAVLIAQEFGISEQEILKSLQSFDFAYGRGESVVFKDSTFRIFLAKNPESLNQNLKMLNESSLGNDSLLFILNDNIPDGHDVSWIFDVHTGLLNMVCRDKKVFVAGTRALDMAIRLKYAAVKFEEENVISDLPEVIEIINSNPKCKNVVVLPNYSAMLEFRKIVLGKSIL